MRRIKYICYYNGFSNKQNRNYPLSAKNKIDYIICTCNQLGVGVDLVSCASAMGDNLEVQKYTKIIENDNSLTLFASIGGSKKLLVLLDLIVVRIQLMLYLLFKTKRKEQVLVYHSMGYALILYLIGRLKGIRYIGEIEELYQDVSQKSRLSRYSEYKFINYCETFIFPTIFLNERLNIKSKPFIIVHGIYRMVPKVDNRIFNGRKIHVVYAGTLDARKGSLDAIGAARFLPENYHIHILGIGTPEEVQKIKQIVTNANVEGCATVSYDGVLDGQDFIEFIQSCSIGLVTQDLKASFTSTSFPSKVLTYMSNGLSVVSIDIPTIRQSAVGSLIYFYKHQDAKTIAATILTASCSLDNYNKCSKVLRTLDCEFHVSLQTILSY